MAKLITENLFEDFKVITEAETESRPQTIFIEGIYIQTDKKNGNERTYSYEMMKPVVDGFIKEKIETNQALEELEHPQEVSINPDRVCCRTVALQETDDKCWKGRSVVLASDPKFGIKGTPCGDIVKSLLQYDVKLGHSTRGVGEIDESTGEVSQFQLICIDTVMNPSIGIYNTSNGNRFVNGILESKDFVINEHGEILERKYDTLEKSLKRLPVKRADRDEKVFKAIDEFLKGLCN